MKLISLTQGQFAQVDDEDFEYINQWKWCAVKSRGTFYAQRRQWHPVAREAKGYYEKIHMHRLIINTPTGMLTDHRDHNGLNNQKWNLRNCTQSQNSRNRKSQKNASSKYLGVSLRVARHKWQTKKMGLKIYVRKRWVAEIRVNGKLIYLGEFPYTDEGEKKAAICRNEASMKHFGEFAKLNNVAC